MNSVNIRIHPVEYLEYKIPVRATGMLSTSSQMKLSFKSGGLVSKVHVKEGESVEEGKTLAVLDLSEIGAHVKQAQIGFEKAKRDLLRARNVCSAGVPGIQRPRPVGRLTAVRTHQGLRMRALHRIPMVFAVSGC